MKTINSNTTKLILSAVGIALLATPAFAKKAHHRTAHQAAHHERTKPSANKIIHRWSDQRHPCVWPSCIDSTTIIPSSNLYGGSYGDK